MEVGVSLVPRLPARPLSVNNPMRATEVAGKCCALESSKYRWARPSPGVFWPGLGSGPFFAAPFPMPKTTRPTRSRAPKQERPDMLAVELRKRERG
jgi:hypothetical protein